MPKAIKTINWRGFVSRTLIVLVIGLVLYGGYLLFTHYHNKSTDQATPKSVLRASLNEHLLSLSAMRDIDSSNNSTPYRLEGVRGQIDTSLKNYQKDLSKHRKTSSELNHLKLDDFTSKEEGILKTYDSNYQILKKPLSYSVSQDIGFINPATDKQEITTRAKITTDNLSQLKISSFLSQKTQTSLTLSINCISGIGQNPPNDQDSLVASIKKCDQLYQTTKSNMITDLTSVFRGQEAQELFTNLRKIIEQLN